MGSRKAKNTKHAYMRSKQRFGLNEETTKAMCLNALHNGLSPNQIQDEEIREYLLSKAQSGKRIKLYKNKVFVFCKTSTRCITIYDLDLGDKKDE